MTATDAAGQTTTYTYYPEGDLHTVTNAKSETTTYVYDSNGQLTSETGPVAGTTTTYEYDGYGRLWRMTDPESRAITMEYDALDRPTKTTYSDGTYEEVVYDKLDAVKQRDQLGRWTQTFYDALRRPVATRDPAGRVTQKNEWVSCPSGCGGGGAKISKLIDANGNTTTWEYDLQSRVTQEIRANGATYNYTYENTTSRLASVQDPNGSVKTFAYNRDNTLAGTTHQPGSGVAATPNVSFTYDPVYNRLATMTDGTGATQYAYYAPGVLGAGRVQSVDGPLANDTITYGYDELGRIASRSVGGSAQTRQFDSLGRLTTKVNPLGAFTYSYEGATQRPSSVAYANGHVTTYAYVDNLGGHRLQEIWNKKSDGSTLSKFDYTYNAVGNILTWRQQTGSSAAQVYQLGYDEADQLTSAILQSTDPTPVVLKRYYYGYDPAGNRTAEQIDDGVTVSTYNNMNQLVSQAAGGALTFRGTVSEPATVTVGGRPATVTADNHFTGAAVVSGGTGTVAVAARDMAGNLRTNTYQVNQGGAGKSFVFDQNGNMTSDGSNTYTWDAENRLTAVVQASGDSVTFAYDGLGRRARVTELHAGNVLHDRRVVWCGALRCQEIDGVAQTTFFGEGMVRNGESLFYTQDHLGSVRELVDASGTLRERFNFDPYGRMQQTLSQTDWKLGFTGHPAEFGGSLILPRNRAYSPSLAQWLSEDPIGLADGPNRYTYVRNDPIRFFDPDGTAAAAGPSWKDLYNALVCAWKTWKCNKESEKRCNCNIKVDPQVQDADTNTGEVRRWSDGNAGKREDCIRTTRRCCHRIFRRCMIVKNGGDAVPYSETDWAGCYTYDDKTLDPCPPDRP